MSIQLKIERPDKADKFFESAENLVPHTKRGMEKALWRSGKDIQGEFNRQVLAKNKTGTLYIRRDKIGRGRKHIASAEGETAANRTGNYRKSFGLIVRSHRELVIGNAAEYAGFLEVGTSKMKPRPGLNNSIAASEGDILRNFTEEISDQI